MNGEAAGPGFNPAGAGPAKRWSNKDSRPLFHDPLNNALKTANAMEVERWRYVQHLADIRNLCDHDKKREPTAEQANDLIDGVVKTIKPLF